MQNNTTGISMVEFFYIPIIVLLSAILIIQSVVIKILLLMKKDMESTKKQYSEDTVYFIEAFSEIEENIDVLRESMSMQFVKIVEKIDENLQEITTQPMKPNNWHSMHKAFSGPSKVEIDP